VSSGVMEGLPVSPIKPILSAITTVIRGVQKGLRKGAKRGLFRGCPDPLITRPLTTGFQALAPSVTTYEHVVTPLMKGMETAGIPASSRIPHQ